MKNLNWRKFNRRFFCCHEILFEYLVGFKIGKYKWVCSKS